MLTRRDFLGMSATAALGAGLPACLLDGDLKRRLDYRPADLDDGWSIAEPADVGLDPDALEAVYRQVFSENDFHLCRSLLVARDGLLVAEGYPRSLAFRERLQHVKSVSKSVTSLLCGSAAERGLVDLDRPIPAYLPAAFAKRPGDDPRRQITLRMLLTMYSGLDWENDEETTRLMIDRPADSVAFVLDRPLLHPPGGFHRYKDGDPHLAGAVLQAVTGKRLWEQLVERFLEPLNIAAGQWEHHRDGIDYGAYGLYLRPRDMLRLGELCRLEGTWNGRSLIGADWLAESTSVQVSVASLGAYGYLWWLNPELGAYFASGHGGQYIAVVPRLRLSVVMTAEPYTVTPSFGIDTATFESLLTELVRAAS